MTISKTNHTIAKNIDRHCLVIGPGRLEVQPALSAVEIGLLRALDGQGEVTSFNQLATELGYDYSSALASLYRLRLRGLVSVQRKNGYALRMQALAQLAD